MAIAAVAVIAAPAPAVAAPKEKKEVDCTQVKCLALTFDDGPSKYAGKLLDILKKHDAKATFFLQGQYVKSRPSFVKRMVKEGHGIGNHSYSHPDFTKADAGKIRSEIKKTNDAIKKAAGVEPKLLRPPYGLSDLQVSDIAAEFGMPIVLWTGGSRDWESRDVEKIKKQTMSVVKGDAIILMHDWVKQTVDAMPAIIKTLQRNGYHLVTVDDIIKHQDLKPGDAFPLPEGWEN
ncbi:MAG TPA: polysaccharide deacetylase family protein [Nonomuraea sp.]|uniref:polysaccharide deacetylase family protein n=1 Tax=Nonomuraea sp. NPDC049649 TaxID=3155776 RepID=UPI002B9251C2|nr:polysaccharide deacetylase family protein [Nonomuraea sp.]